MKKEKKKITAKKNKIKPSLWFTIPTQESLFYSLRIS